MTNCQCMRENFLILLRVVLTESIWKGIRLSDLRFRFKILSIKKIYIEPKGSVRKSI